MACVVYACLRRHLPGQLQIPVPCCVVDLSALTLAWSTVHTCVMLCTCQTLTFARSTCLCHVMMLLPCSVVYILDTYLVNSRYLCHVMLCTCLPWHLPGQQYIPVSWCVPVKPCQVNIPVPCNVYLSTLTLAWSTAHTCVMLCTCQTLVNSANLCHVMLCTCPPWHLPGHLCIPVPCCVPALTLHLPGQVCIPVSCSVVYLSWHLPGQQCIPVPCSVVYLSTLTLAWSSVHTSAMLCTCLDTCLDTYLVNCSSCFSTVAAVSGQCPSLSGQFPTLCHLVSTLYFTPLTQD